MQSQTLPAALCLGAALTLISCTSDEAMLAPMQLASMGPPGQPRVCGNNIMPGVELPDTADVAAEIDLRTMAGGSVGGALLQSESDLAGLLAQTGDPGFPLRANIAATRGSDYGDGLAGVAARLFLNAADFAAGPGGSGATYTPVIAETKGQIEAYYFNKAQMSGCLQVLMTTTATKPSGAVRTEALRWTVFVDPVGGSGFQFNEKLAESDPNYDASDVFNTGPGTDADTVAINAAMAENFTTKLWAKGDTITVESVERSINGGPFVRVPDGHALYEVNPHSCIDMMFAGTPPMVLPPDAEPPFYCLGRCESVYIVNTK